MEKVEAVIRKVEGLADPRTGLVREEAVKGDQLREFVETAKADAERLTVEIRAGADDAVAIVLMGRPMRDLILAAKAGDDDALFAAIQINPHVIKIAGINARFLAAVGAGNTVFLQRLQRALRSRLPAAKNARIGFTLAALWEAGLMRLTYRQIRGFLKASGFRAVPPPQALERYAQRMGLKKYWIEAEQSA